MVRPQIGDKFIITATLKRDTTDVDGRLWRVWRRQPYEKLDYRRGSFTHGYYHPDTRWQQDPPATSFEGYYIGYRNLSNGKYWRGNNYDDPPSLDTVWRTEAWLIVPNETQNPVRVHPDDCQIAAPGD